MVAVASVVVVVVVAAAVVAIVSDLWHLRLLLEGDASVVFACLAGLSGLQPGFSCQIGLASSQSAQKDQQRDCCLNAMVSLVKNLDVAGNTFSQSSVVMRMPRTFRLR